MKNFKKRLLVGVLTLALVATPLAAYASPSAEEGGQTEDAAEMDSAMEEESLNTGLGSDLENNTITGSAQDEQSVMDNEAVSAEDEKTLLEAALHYEELFTRMEALWDQASVMEDSDGAEKLWDELMALWEQIYAAEENGTSGLSEEERATLDALTDQICDRLGELGYDPYALLALDDIGSYEGLMGAINGQTGTIEITLTNDLSASETHITLTAGADVTIDLNGYTITADDGGNGALFTVPTGASLTIADSRASVAIKGTGEEVVATDAGKLASMTGSIEDGISLTYYVTESVVTDSATGTTQETRYPYTVDSAGMICTTGANHSLFSVTGGTLNIEGGFFYGESESSGNRAIDANSGTVNLSGGYICGFDEAYSSEHTEDLDGGAVRVTNGAELNISGNAVLAANKAATGGAVDVANGATLNMTGGVISGNEATEDVGTNEWNNDYGGGGIHAYGSGTTVNISGGYLTNNVSDCEGYFDGGGGILVNGGTLNFSGGFITGNRAASSGGGIRTAYAAYTGQTASVVYITGGYLCANYAESAEGGGLCLDNGSYGEVTAVSAIYVNNNATNTSEHWGGGGIFCANGSTMYMTDALITDNDAGGFGGGVAGCSTGRIAISEDAGAAIYGNTALGLHTSGSGSTKHDDTDYALNDKVFMENGFADYYCALESMVSGMMLGGGSANWSGSADGVAIKEGDVGTGDYLWATYIMGLTAHPDGDAIASAQGVASVYITGNSSYTHGGGILSNGYLFLGNVENYEIGDALQINADKVLINQDGAYEEIEDGQFTFEITDEEGNWVSTGTTQSGGSIFFERRIPFNEAGTFTFYIKETSSDDSNIVMDSSVYTLVVTVSESNEEIEVAGVPIDFTYYNISHITLTKSGDSEPLIDQDISSPDDEITSITIPSPAFVNYETDEISITVHKTWEDENGDSMSWPEDIEEITVHLLQNGEEYGEAVTLTEENDSYTWTGLPTRGKDTDGNDISYEYEVRENTVSGYITSYETTNATGSSSVSYWVPVDVLGETDLQEGGKYLIVNSDGTMALSLTADHVDSSLTAADREEITPTTGELTIGNKTYTSWYTDDSVSDAMTWVATTTSTYNYAEFEHIILKNAEYTQSSLLVQGNSGNYTGLKGCSGDTWGSAMKLENGMLMGQHDESSWLEGNEWSYIIYADNRFNSSLSDYSDAVRVYRQVQPVTASTEITIINQSTQTYGFELKKTDTDGDGIEGAEFQISQMIDDASVTLWFILNDETYTLCDENVEGATATISAGSIKIEGLPEGTYYLYETKAPDGYIKLDSPIVITITADGIMLGEDSDPKVSVSDDGTLLTVQNTEALVLPNMGGSGTLRFMLVGLVVICGGAVCFGVTLYRRRGRYV